MPTQPPGAKPSPPMRLRRVLARMVILVTTILLIFWATGCMERLFYYPHAGLTPPPTTHPGAESVWFTSQDGTKLHGWFIPARGGSSNTAPTILHVHGNAGNIESHIWFTEYLPEAGFNLFIFDFRGYGQSEGRAHKRKGLIEDTHAALDAILARTDIDPSRIGLYGQSLGGAIGLNVMADRNEIQAGVSESAFASWREVAASAVGGDPPGVFSRGLAKLLIGDSDRPIDAIGRIKRPILLLHGTADSVVPFSHGQRLADAAGAWADFHALTGGQHNSLRESHPEVMKLIIDFYRDHLKESPKAADDI